MNKSEIGLYYFWNRYNISAKDRKEARANTIVMCLLAEEAIEMSHRRLTNTTIVE
jgi:hypothetical protein